MAQLARTVRRQEKFFHIVPLLDVAGRVGMIGNVPLITNLCPGVFFYLLFTVYSCVFVDVSSSFILFVRVFQMPLPGRTGAVFPQRKLLVFE